MSNIKSISHVILQRTKEEHNLIRELDAGRKSGEEEEWIPSEDVRSYFNIRMNEE